MDVNELKYRLFYWFGFTPWEGHVLPARLRELVEESPPLAVGKALDVGCGTGDTSIYLARHGWDVTAFDFVQRALGKARAKFAAAGVQVRLQQADVTKLDSYGIGSGFQLIVDNGCLHGLSDKGRGAYVRQITAAAAPNATLLLAGFTERKRTRGPRGYDRPEIERRFAADWQLLGSWQDPAVSTRPDDPIFVYELRRR
jgi:cyclopropane fatty-acyl-phospholipid synthase-like methyltransferase